MGVYLLWGLFRRKKDEELIKLSIEIVRLDEELESKDLELQDALCSVKLHKNNYEIRGNSLLKLQEDVKVKNSEIIFLTKTKIDLEVELKGKCNLIAEKDAKLFSNDAKLKSANSTSKELNDAKIKIMEQEGIIAKLSAELRGGLFAKDIEIKGLESKVCVLENDVDILNSILNTSAGFIECDKEDEGGTTVGVDSPVVPVIASYLLPLCSSNILDNFKFFVFEVVREPKDVILKRRSLDDLTIVYEEVLKGGKNCYLHPKRLNTLVVDGENIGVVTDMYSAYIGYHDGKYSISKIEVLMLELCDSLNVVLKEYKDEGRLDSLSIIDTQAYYSDEEFDVIESSRECI